MLIVVGLGNPGYEYDQTRHNLGFRVIDALSEFTRIDLKGGRGEYLAGKRSTSGGGLVLAKPVTYVNNSGFAVRDILDRYDAGPEDLLVVADDFQLPMGRLRLRMGGSSGGHNGLYSIIYHLGTEDFPRLRCGIGGTPSMPADKRAMAEFVLSPFDAAEEEDVSRMICRARDAVLVAAAEGLQAAINRFNTK